MEKITDTLLPKSHIKDLLNLRKINKTMNVKVDEEINHRHKLIFGDTEKSIGLKIKDLITDEIRGKLSTNFADLEASDVGYGLLLLDPPIQYEYEWSGHAWSGVDLWSNTLPSYIHLKPLGGDDEVYFDVRRLISARDGMIIKYPNLKSTLIHNFHIILAGVYYKFEKQFMNNEGLYEWTDEDWQPNPPPDRPVMEVLKLDHLFNEKKFDSFLDYLAKGIPPLGVYSPLSREGTPRHSTAQMKEIFSQRAGTEALVREIACNVGKSNPRMKYRTNALMKCGFVANKSLLNLLSPDAEYGVYDMIKSRADFESLFSAERRLDKNDISLLREYMEYRIGNGSIRDRMDLNAIQQQQQQQQRQQQQQQQQQQRQQQQQQQQKRQQQQ